MMQCYILVVFDRLLFAPGNRRKKMIDLVGIEKSRDDKPLYMPEMVQIVIVISIYQHLDIQWVFFSKEGRVRVSLINKIMLMH